MNGEPCPEGPHRGPEGPNEDVAQCTICWLVSYELRPEGETYGDHLPDCSLPLRHESYCQPGGAGHPTAPTIRGYWPEREAARYDDPFSLTPPSAEESARVASDAALLTAAADRLERQIAKVPPIPWHPVASHPAPGVRTASGWEVAYASYADSGEAVTGLIATMVNAGPDLVAWLRSAARDAEEIGPDRFAVALARTIVGEGQS